MAFLGPSLRRKKVIDRPVRRVAAAALISIAANAGLLLVLALAGAFDVPKPTKTEKVELAQLGAKEWERNRTVAKLPGLVPPPVEQEEPVVPPPEPEVKKEVKPRGQVVDTGPSNDQRPDDARHLSERNNRVEKETRSRWQGSGNFRNRAPSPTVGDTDRARGGERGAHERSQEAREGMHGTNQKGGKPVPEVRPDPASDRLALLDRRTVPRPTPGAPGSRGDDAGIPGLPGNTQEERRRSGDPKLLPSVEDMSRITAGPSMDALDQDIEEGDATALNTKAYRFATFWNRFKQDVVDHWQPGVLNAVEARDPAGTTFGPRDRITGLRVVLDRTGAVKEIEVVSPSGLDFLDRVAVKSVRAAAPFYNVPPALLDEKEELSFECGFLVERSRAIPIRPRWERSP